MGVGRNRESVSPTNEHGAAQRSTFKQEIFLKFQVWTNLRNKVQCGSTTFLRCQPLGSHFMQFIFRGNLHSELHLCAWRTSLLQNAEKGKITDLDYTKDRFKATCFQNKTKRLLNKMCSQRTTANFSRVCNFRSHGLGLECLKTNPKVNFSRRWLPHMGQDQLHPPLSCWDFGEDSCSLIPRGCGNHRCPLCFSVLQHVHAIDEKR